MKLTTCVENKTDCFQNLCGAGCKLLREPIYDHPCPFYKTELEADEGRALAHQRLLKEGRKDLIELYEYNKQRKW